MRRPSWPPMNPPTMPCHCKRVQIQLPFKPEKINECHCTVCYKYGALWGYFKRDKIVIKAGENLLVGYVREDSKGDLDFIRWYG